MESNTVYKEIEFSGFIWRIKASEEQIGPGPNYFSDRNEDVWVDEKGRLHLLSASETLCSFFVT